MAAGSEAVFVPSSALTFPLRWQIFEMAARHRLPTVWEASDYVVDGGLRVDAVEKVAVLSVGALDCTVG